MTGIALAWRLARRELRGGLKGFRIFFLCLLLGTAAIAGVESMSDAFLTGLRDSGQTFLGGDVAVTLVHRPATDTERTFLERYGRISSNISMQSMAYALRDGKQAERQLVEVKAVSEAWPLFGAPSFTPAQSLADMLSIARMTGYAARRRSRLCSTASMSSAATCCGWAARPSA